MGSDFIRTSGLDFTVNGKKIRLRGFGLGNWLNTEHFMLGIPGIERQLRAKIIEAYGSRNALDFWRIYYNCYAGEADFRFLAQSGVNAVRLPFNYHHFEDDRNPYNYNTDGFVELDRVLSYCARYGIYAILDLHAAPGGQNPDWHCDNVTGESQFWDDRSFQDRAIALWKHIAARYAGNPWVAAYDLLNEPVLIQKEKAQIVSFYNRLIPAIRELDKDHLLFVEGDWYSTDFTMFESLPDDNIACTFHFYPMFFGSLIPKNPVRRKNKIEEIFTGRVTLEHILDKLRVPVWCGETGAVRNRGSVRLGESMLSDMLDILESRSISWSLWAYKDSGSMGALYPKADSPWMRFARRAGRGWKFWKEFEAAHREAKSLARRSLSASPRLIEKRLHNRILASRHLVHSEFYSELFSQIPFSELVKYPESFRFEDCDKWTAVVDLFLKHTGAA